MFTRPNEGWIFAADSSYAVVTGEDGTLKIDDIPPGEFTLKISHPFLGIQEQSVTLAAGESSEVEFDFTVPSARSLFSNSP